MKLLLLLSLLIIKSVSVHGSTHGTIECDNGFSFNNHGTLLIQTEGNRDLDGYLPTKFWINTTYFYMEGMYWDNKINAYYGTTNPRYSPRRSAAIYFYNNGENAVSLVLKKHGQTNTAKEVKFSNCSM